MKATYKSADGTVRCLACALHADQCTCDTKTAFAAFMRALVDHLRRG